MNVVRSVVRAVASLSQGAVTRGWSSAMDPLENAKQAAAFRAVSEYIKGDTVVVGVGSGTTMIYVVEELAERVKTDEINVICIPTSFQARQLILDHRLTLGNLETHPKLDCAIDGADEVDAEMNLIKGGGGCLLQEKIVASCTKHFVVVADYTKNSQKLGEQYKKGIPIEVVPMAHVPISNKIEAMYGGIAKIRMALAKAGPVVTDNGNFILDWHFPQDTTDWSKINREISLIPGVVETGLFINMAEKVFFGMADGSVKVQKSKM